MKKFVLVLMLAHSFSMLLAQGTGYITLDGRQFKDGLGGNFYPIICPYGITIAFNSNTPNSFYLSADFSYGSGFTSSSCTACPPIPNFEFDHDNQPDCLNQIHDELSKIKKMGFNAIRTYGLGVYKKTGVIGFTLKADDNHHPNFTPQLHPQFLPITPTPYAYDDVNNTNVQLLFSFYDLLFQVADNIGVKVLLDIGGGDIAAHSTDVADYAAYLSALADRYKNNTALMAYVVIEEPSYSEGGRNQGHTKEEICDITTQWYDAIKAKDKNHLVTMGGADLRDVVEWDPGVMKLDFYCPHIYPRNQVYEGYDILKATDRVLGDLIWLKNNCPIPWVIGETSFSACDDSYYKATALNWVPQPVAYPAVDGSIQDQANYGQFILDAVRNTNGSGISWWNYQEHWWGVPEYQDGFGLLRHGDLNDPNIEKPVVNVFKTYPVPPPAPLSITPPSNYYNPFNLTPSTYAYSGKVLDEATGNPVRDAIVFAWTNYYVNGDPLPHGDFINTFTDKATGTYSLEPLNPNSILFQNYPLTQITEIVATSASAEREYHGGWIGANLPSTIYLRTSPFNFDLLVDNEIIDASNSPRNYTGWNTLTVTNVSVLSGGRSEMHARNEVSVQAEISAENGSEVHIYCSPVNFPDCPGAISGFLRKSNNTASETNNQNAEKSIEVKFGVKTNSSYLVIKPNPNNGYFTVELKNSIELKNDLRIVDVLGNTVFQKEMVGNNSEINLGDFTKGVYYVKITNQFGSNDQKIIIQ